MAVVRDRAEDDQVPDGQLQTFSGSERPHRDSSRRPFLGGLGALIAVVGSLFTFGQAA